MRKNQLLIALGAVAALLVDYAWVDGGRESLHEIVQPIAVPGQIK